MQKESKKFKNFLESRSLMWAENPAHMGSAALAFLRPIAPPRAFGTLEWLLLLPRQSFRVLLCGTGM